MAFSFLKRPAGNKKLGIYVHIPFCKSKCEYCDFYSLGGSRDRHVTDDYLQALADHIKESGRLAPEYVVDTVYFGGGTPSFFGVENLEKILDEIQRRFRLDADAEITLEANPDSAQDISALRQLHDAGFDRLSLGMQSADDAELRRIGRVHTHAQTVRAVENARAAGFDNLSLDLIYGLPGQTMTRWQANLDAALALAPEHLSCYGLKVEPGTKLWTYKDCANLPDDDAQADMYFYAVETLEQFGYHQYEISNFAHDGFICRHNMKYWVGDEYLGFGPCAASDFAGRRFTIKPDLEGYIKGVTDKGQILSESELVPLRERAGEYLMLRLRTAQGIDGVEYRRNYFMDFAPLERRLEEFQAQGWAEKTAEGRWRFTPKGFLVSNQLIGDLLDRQEQASWEDLIVRPERGPRP